MSDLIYVVVSVIVFITGAVCGAVIIIALQTAACG